MPPFGLKYLPTVNGLAVVSEKHWNLVTIILTMCGKDSDSVWIAKVMVRD